METAVADSHRKSQSRERHVDEMRRNLNARFTTFLCNCGRTNGGRDSGRCDECLSYPRHPVELRMTETSALLFTMRRLPLTAAAYRETLKLPN